MRRLNNNIHDHTVAGKLMPAYTDGQPVLLTIDGENFLPLFSDKDKLAEVMSHAKVQRYATMQITDASGFWESVRGKIRIILDPWKTPQGTTRFHLLVERGDELPPVGEQA